MSSAQYNLANPGPGRRANGQQGGLDAYRSPFSPTGQAHFVWSERPMPLAQILKDNALPVVVKISEEANVRAEGDNCLDFRQPLLLYRQQKTARLYSRNLTSPGSSSNNNNNREVGPFVVIPHSYPGLFRPCDPPGSPLTSMSTIARLMPVSVLSCTRCDGYVCVSPIPDDVTYQKTSLEPGVYTIKDIVEDDIVIHSGGHKGKKTKLVRCLRCLDANNKEVLFPLKCRGQFYVAGLDNRGSRHGTLDPSARVYRWPELTHLEHPTEKQKCEMQVRLLHGNPPPQECSFTGILAFKHVIEESTVIGCTTSEVNPRLFELSPFKGPDFVVALNQDCFDNDSPINKCLKFAKQEFDGYVTELKVRRDYEVDSAEIRESST